MASATDKPVSTSTTSAPGAITGATYYDDSIDEDDYVMVERPEGEKKGLRKWCDKFCCCCCCFYCQNGKVVLSGLALAAIYWALLWVFAHAYSPGYQRFTLTVGQTFQVQTPLNLWSRKSLSIQAFPVTDSNSTSAAGLEVFEFLPVLDYGKPAVCPPLTLGDDPALGSTTNSPMLTLHESQQRIQLGTVDGKNKQYDYEYFHLNKGSILQVHAQLVAPQSSNEKTLQMGGSGLGAANIYIIQGYHALRELELNSESLVQNFRGKSIEKWFLAYSGSIDLAFTTPESDYYIVVYDNAAPGRSTNLQVSVNVRMSTHYLSEVNRPICSAKDTLYRHGCEWTFTNDQDRQRVASTCIIAKAVSPQLNYALQTQLNITSDGDNKRDDGNRSSTTALDTDGNQQPMVDMSMKQSQSVIVKVHAPLGSTRFIVLALAPIIILVTMWFLENGQRCIQHVRRHGCAAALCPCFSRGRDEEIGKEEMLPLVDERTPLKRPGISPRPKR